MKWLTIETGAINVRMVVAAMGLAGLIMVAACAGDTDRANTVGTTVAQPMVIVVKCDQPADVGSTSIVDLPETVLVEAEEYLNNKGYFN